MLDAYNPGECLTEFRVACPRAGLKFAIRADGAVVIAMPMQISPPMIVLDGATGQTILNAPIPPSTFTTLGGQVSSCDCFTPVGQPMVDSDGSVYVEYFVQNDLQLPNAGCPLAVEDGPGWFHEYHATKLL
jgi:hypothetical protein